MLNLPRAGDILKEELLELLKYGLINCESYISDIEDIPDDIIDYQISVTQSGIYYANNLVTEFYYMNLVLQDTPIYNEDDFDEISRHFCSPDVYGKRPLNKKIKCVESFIDYLKKEELKDNAFSIPSGNKALDMSIVDYILKTNLSSRLKTMNGYYISNIDVKE